MIRIIVIIFSFILSTCFASPFSIVKSESVTFKNTCLTLHGPLTLETKLGKIQANKAVLNVENTLGKLDLQKATVHGDVEISFFKGGIDPIKATCDQATYCENVVTLCGNVVIDFSKRGLMQSNDRVELKINEQQDLQMIKCFGDCKYRLEDENKDIDIALIAKGEIVVDCLQGKIHMQATGDSSQNQLYFRDHFLKIFSDVATGTCDFKPFVLKTLELKGHVFVLNRTGTIMQLALADTGTYDHGACTLVLKSQEGGSVKLYDKINELQVSAPEIVVRREKGTEELQFQGVGDVRMDFAEKEFEAMKNRLLLEKKNLTSS